MSVPSQDLECHTLWYFIMFNDLRSEVIVRLVDIGDIVDHHYLNFVVVIVWKLDLQLKL